MILPSNIKEEVTEQQSQSQPAISKNNEEGTEISTKSVLLMQEQMILL